MKQTILIVLSLVPVILGGENPSYSQSYPEYRQYQQAVQQQAAQQQYQHQRQQPAARYQQQEGAGEGLQRYSTQGKPHQQVLLSSSVDKQVQRVGQLTGPLFLQQVQSEAQESAQYKAAPAAPLLRHVPGEAHQRHYDREGSRYSRPVQLTYRTSVPQDQAKLREEEQEDYDHNPSYQFGFDVKDDLYTNYQNRKEQREGNVITGSYSVVDSDGYIRTVKYVADPKEGFKAEVTREKTDIVVKVPRPDQQYDNRGHPVQYVQVEDPKQQLQSQKGQLVYQYQ